MTNPPYLLEEVMCGIAKEVSIDHGWASNLRGRVLLSGVGPTNEMQSVSCGDKCAWDEGISNLAMWDTHFTTELANLPTWMEDVKAIMEKDFWGKRMIKRGKCLPPGYFWLRFGSGNDDMLGPSTGLNGTVNLQLSFMTSKATVAKWGIKHGHVLEVLEQLTLCKCVLVTGCGWWAGWVGGLFVCWRSLVSPPIHPSIPSIPHLLDQPNTPARITGTRDAPTGERTTSAPTPTPAARCPPCTPNLTSFWRCSASTTPKRCLSRRCSPRWSRARPRATRRAAR